jgi:hypothetical protein
MVHTCLFCQLMHRQVWSWWQQQEMAPNFLHAAWQGEAFHGLGIQDIESLILVVALFLLEGGRRTEGKKEKKSQLRRGFPQGWTRLAVSVAGCSC